MNWLEYINSTIKVDDPNNTKGNLLESIAKEYFQEYYSSRVYSYGTWAISNHLSHLDYGIDLVMEYEDQIYGIQVKYRQEKLSYAELATFFSEVGNISKIDAGIIFTNSYVSDIVKKQLDKYADKYTFIDRDKLEKQEYKPSKTEEQPIKLRDYQLETIEKVHKELKTEDRCNIVIPCGGGKTITSIKTIEKIYSGGNKAKILFVMPSLSLISQTVENFVKYLKLSFDYSINCSDKSIDEEFDNISYQKIRNDNLNRVSTDVVFHQKLIKSSTKDIFIVFSTYQSIDIFENSNVKFDFMVADEAHHTTGYVENTSFSAVLYDDKVKIDKRLFMTATPRIYKTDKEDIVCRSMDNKSLYGNKVISLSYSDLISKGYLSHYKIVVPFTSDSIEEKFKKYIKIDVVDKETVVNLADSMVLLEIVKRILKNNERKVIFYLNTTNRARACMRMVNSIVNYLKKTDNIYSNINVKYGYITGDTSGSKRETILKYFKQGSDFDFYFLFNVRCLSEGVDVQDLNSIVYTDPKSSYTQIYQSLGRVIRKSPKKDFGTVYIPILIDSQQLQDEYKNDIVEYLKLSKKYQKEGHSFHNLLKVLIALSFDSSVLRDLGTIYLTKMKANEDLQNIINFSSSIDVEFLSSDNLFKQIDGSAIWKSVFNSKEFTKGAFSRDLTFSVLLKNLLDRHPDWKLNSPIPITSIKEAKELITEKKYTINNICRDYKHFKKHKYLKGDLLGFIEFLARDGRVFY